jgi:hypothetical protein
MNQDLELSQEQLDKINHEYSLLQNKKLVTYWNRRNRRHRAGGKKVLGASYMKLRPAKVDNVNQTYTSSFWSVVVTKKNGEKRLHADFDHNVWPSATIDYIHNMAFIDTTASKRGFGCIAVTADTTQTLNAAMTALTGEITTNGLARVEAGTKNHTASSNSSLVEHTFTLSGSQSDIQRSALFNVATAPVSGTIGPAAAFSNGATGAMSTGETVKVSITINTS